MQDNTVIPFPHPQLMAEDPRTAVLRQGAQRLLAQAIEMEVALLLAPYADRRDTQGREAPQRADIVAFRHVGKVAHEGWTDAAQVNGSTPRSCRK